MVPQGAHSSRGLPRSAARPPRAAVSVPRSEGPHLSEELEEVAVCEQLDGGLKGSERCI